MDRPEIYDQAQGRDYDVLHGWRETLLGLGQAVLDLLGSNSTVVTGLAATQTGPTSLSIDLAAGDIYQLAQVDAASYGSLSVDTTLTMQQGYAASQVLALSTAGLSSGQSRWALIQATFTQTDNIPSDDPNGGLLPYLNTSNPTGPAWSGPNNSGATQPTRRQGICTVSVIYGIAATTGSEVPPNPSANNVGLYLIDLAYGQTAITSSEILVAGPSVGTGVPSNYPQAPFLAGLLNSHHSGGAGQAPKIKLTSEVQGQLPAANIAAPAVQVVNGPSSFAASGIPGAVSVMVSGASRYLLHVQLDGNYDNTNGTPVAPIINFQIKDGTTVLANLVVNYQGGAGQIAIAYNGPLSFGGPIILPAPASGSYTVTPTDAETDGASHAYSNTSIKAVATALL